jgi:hypothetical protein
MFVFSLDSVLPHERFEAECLRLRKGPFSIQDFGTRTIEANRALPAISRVAIAQAYPSRPITLGSSPISFSIAVLNAPSSVEGSPIVSALPHNVNRPGVSHRDRKLVAEGRDKLLL